MACLMAGKPTPRPIEVVLLPTKGKITLLQSFQQSFHFSTISSFSKLVTTTICFNCNSIGINIFGDSLKACGWFWAEYWFDIKNDVISGLREP
jgi:hypothetical protein